MNKEKYSNKISIKNKRSKQATTKRSIKINGQIKKQATTTLEGRT